VLRGIFELESDEVMGGQRKVHNEGLHALLKFSRMRWARHVAQMSTARTAYILFEEEPEEKRPLGRPTHRWVDNIMLVLVAIGCGVAQDRDRWRAHVDAVMNLWGSTKC
jgi:hypothetical protein